MSVQLGRSPVSASTGHPSRAPHVAGVLLGVAALIFAVGLTVGLALVGRHGGGAVHGVDEAVQAWSVRHRGPFGGVSRAVGRYADWDLLLAVSAMVSLALVALTRRLAGLVPLVACTGGGFVAWLLRRVIHRPRPSTAVFPAVDALPGVHKPGWSYPSGHVAVVAAVLFGVLGFVALSRRTWWPWPVAALLSGAVAETRLVVGVHWLSDVVVGLAIGTVWGVTVAFAARQVEWADVRALLRR